MIAARLHAVGDLRVGTEDDPGDAPPGWSLLAVTSVGICGSDLHWFTDGGIGENRIEHPVVPGHEFAARAVTGPYAGRRVAVDPAIPCRVCELCLAGHHNLCPTVQFAGHGTLDGALQEYLVWPDRLLHPLPDELSDDAGALLEPLGVAIHAVDVSHLHPGDDVLVVGAGPIGVLAVQVALRAGASRVFVTEPLGHRRATALRHGATAASSSRWRESPSIVRTSIGDSRNGMRVTSQIRWARSENALHSAPRPSPSAASSAAGMSRISPGRSRMAPSGKVYRQAMSRRWSPSSSDAEPPPVAANRSSRT